MQDAIAHAAPRVGPSSTDPLEHTWLLPGSSLPAAALHNGPRECALSPSVQVPHKLCPATVNESLALGTLSEDEDRLEDLEEEEDNEQLAEEESHTLQDILEVSGHD
ncbi:uncharacterized protein F5147DRAFT_767192 [Suillus discolor]|uniref:Uncharacterized protein n=1 Tax=Suillus discolor TaxID=1912936 RepID=A0A9P7FLX1_9AGAM|nr:uncharacterized protein F5147DRAFT_767192 [Suillus discolor]KAG2119718.1 hypothetical protein F5147DRAFT_767192 [Suillus discolor]